MNAETFMWIALELFALAGVVLLVWMLVHFAPHDDDAPPPQLR
jgi:hypothetical protein